MLDCVFVASLSVLEIWLTFWLCLILSSISAQDLSLAFGRGGGHCCYCLYCTSGNRLPEQEIHSCGCFLSCIWTDTLFLPTHHHGKSISPNPQPFFSTLDIQHVPVKHEQFWSRGTFTWRPQLPSPNVESWTFPISE